MIRTFIITFFIVCSASCSHTDIEDYRDVEPKFDIKEFFNGKLEAHGIVKNRSGKVIRTFVAHIDAHWENEIGTLDEMFQFDDGEQQRRIWTLEEIETNDDGGSDSNSRTYTGTADDVIGEATLHQAGNALFLKYVLRIPYKGDTLDIKIDDRMYLIDKHHLINESTMFKFGFRVGEIVLSIRKTGL